MSKIAKNIQSFLSGGIIGTLGGLIGLGGAEFRLPLLNIFFSFSLKDAIILNLIISLFTVIFSLLFRTLQLDAMSLLVEYGFIAINLLAGSLIGSYYGATLMLKSDDTRLKTFVFYLMLFLATILLFHSEFQNTHFTLEMGTMLKIIVTFFAGLGIGIVSSLLGVAGGELIIPTIILLYSVDIKLAGTLSLIVSIPTILISLFKHYKHNKLEVFRTNKTFTSYMIFGSIIGAYLGSLAVGIVSSFALELFLALLLVLSAFKMKYLKKRV